MDQDYVERWAENARGDVALDIGAHDGRYTRRLAARFRRVVAFEPAAEARARLMELSLQNVDVRPEAISDCVGERLLYQFGKRSSEGDSLLPVHPCEGTPYTRAVPVRVLSIDSLLWAGQIDFVKIDVEGAELKVLGGAQATLEFHRPRIQVESHRSENVVEILRRLDFCKAREVIATDKPNVAWVLGY